MSDAINSWSYTIGVHRATNNNTANRVEIVFGILGPVIALDYMQYGTTAGAHFVAICEDCTNTYSLTYGRYGYGGSGQVHSSLRRTPAIGYHYYQMIEFGAASSIFYGSANHLMRGFWDC